MRYCISMRYFSSMRLVIRKKIRSIDLAMVSSVISFTFIMLLLLLVSSCQKVINLKLEPSAREYVIEGIITDQPGYCIVSISQTKNISDDNQFPGISGAKVTVNDQGAVVTLAETKPGIYQTNIINGKPGLTYQLSVTINDQVFTASSTMPQPVELDSIYVYKQDLSTNKYITALHHDPPGVANYYRYAQYVDGLKEKTIFTENDEFTDGQTRVKAQLSYNNDNDNKARNIETGKTVRIDMLCLDPAVYKYWFSLQGATGTNQNASPANPISNIQGGCMGYFSAQTIRTKTLIVP
ncbi:DUF4249 domain-containing protein [Flavitalea flava]